MTDVAPRDPRLTAEIDLTEALDVDTTVTRLLSWLLESCLVLSEEWEDVPPVTKAFIGGAATTDELLDRLTEHELLTEFQGELVRGGRGAEAIVGSYRLLDPIGRGGMGVVYLAEHIHLRRRVAIKMTTHVVEKHPRLAHRFYAEARSVARLQHPNIVGCLDAGRHVSGQPGRGATDFFVMEYVPGKDLDSLIRDGGPLSVHRAAAVFKQIADALAEAHKHGLVHRDLKPSNIIVTPDWQAKLLDFGLALHPRNAMTEPGTLLGTVGYMAPEQARDPHAVDGRADLFALGATLFWALTGKEPYPETGNPINDLTRRLSSGPPDIRTVRPELPADVAELIDQLMAVDPDRRYPSAAAVSTALQPFTRFASVTVAADADADGGRKTKALIVDGDDMSRAFIASLLDTGYEVRQARTGPEALAELDRAVYDLVVLDATPTGSSAQELIAAARRAFTDTQTMILVMSGTLPVAVLSGLVSVGADDFVTKPFTPTELRSRVRALLGRRDTATNLSVGAETLRMTLNGLVRTPAPIAPAAPSANPWDLMTVTVAKLLVEAGYLAPGYRSRVARYVRALSQTVPASGEYARLKDPTYVNLLAASSALFDLGLLVIPGGLPLKPGKLDNDEKQVMETHPSAGAEVLAALAEKFPSETACVSLAAELIHSHHERWDGTGYPERLAGTGIPLAGRVVSLASVYDSLRSRRPFRPAVTHARAVRVITTESQGRFDPILLTAFTAAAARFDQVYNEYPV